MIVRIHGEWHLVNAVGGWVGRAPSGFSTVARWDRSRWEAEHPGESWATARVEDWRTLAYWTPSGDYYAPVRADRTPARTPALPNGILVDEPWPETDDL